MYGHVFSAWCVVDAMDRIRFDGSEAMARAVASEFDVKYAGLAPHRVVLLCEVEVVP